jgi:hypothetical protein
MVFAAAGMAPMMIASSAAAPVFFLSMAFPLMVFRPPWLAA